MLKKIKKGEFGISLNYLLPPLSNYTIKLQSISNIIPSLKTSFEPPKMKIKSILEQTYDMLTPKNNSFKMNFKLQAAKVGTSIAASALLDKVENMFGDSEIGRSLGGIFSQGISSASDTITNNIIKGKSFLEGALKNAGASVAGAAAGLGANLVGKGINALGGDSRLSRGISQGIATGLGTIGGLWASNLVSGTGGLTFGGSGLFSNMSKMEGAINPYALGASVLGSAIGAAAGPSKEYSGKYGNITQTMDTAYDLVSAGANFIPGVGQGISAAMALNKGLSNIFGSTDGMTKTDAILGSAFMPAPVKWLNMAGASTTGNFDNQSWLNLLKADSFMGNAFGNLGDRFAQAREEAGKTYGTFSLGAKREAQRNLNFANQAWNLILAMADLNELLNIRSQVMSSINNLRYAQSIQGGWTPIARGKQGMKIFNNATNHNIGMRLLSGAALIDNKQMILSAQGGTKVKVKKYVAKSTGRTWNTREEAIKDNANYKKDIHYRYGIKAGRYKSPYKNYNIPFIPEKKITLTNAGLATGAILSTNLLDSIAVNAERAGLPIKTAIGLATKESTLNNPTYDVRNRAKISVLDRSQLNRAEARGVEHLIKADQNKGDSDTPESLLINYNPDDNPYASAKTYIFKKGKTWDDVNRMLEETESYADRVAARNESSPSKSYLQAGFEAYKKNPQGYNPGQPNYVQLVQQRANEVWSSPEIQEWYKIYKQSKK